MKSIFLSGFVFSAMSLSAQSTKTGDFHLDKEYKMESSGTLYLDASDAKVFITGSNRTTAHVKIDREVTTKGLVFGEREFWVDVTEQNGNLSIKEKSGGTTVNMVGYHYEKYTIDIEVPEGVSLIVDGDDGDYFIKAIHGSIEIDVDDADVELTGCQGNRFAVKLDDGDLRMDSGRGDLVVEADDADIEIKNASFQKILARIDDGDFIVETVLVENGNYDVDMRDGLLAIKVLGGGGRFDIRHDDARVTTEGGFEIVEKSEDRTRVSLANGNARFQIRADDGHVRLTK